MLGLIGIMWRICHAVRVDIFVIFTFYGKLREVLMVRTITKFEMKMAEIFHSLRGSDSRNLTQQEWWVDIENLKKMAQDEVKQFENNERLFLLKYVNREISKAEQKGSTVKKLTMLYELKKKLSKK